MGQKGHWAEKNAPGMKEKAKEVKRWLKNASKVDYEHWQVKIEDIDKGCKKKKIGKKPWLKK